MEPNPKVSPPALPTTASSLNADQAVVQAELGRLQGKWTLVSTELESSPVEFPANAPTDNAILSPIIQGDTWMGKPLNKELEPFYRLKVNPATDPKQINLIALDRVEDLAGIYKLEGDRLILCWTVDRNTPIRPTQFFTKKDIPVMLSVYKRNGDPAGPQQGAVPKETNPPESPGPVATPAAPVPPTAQPAAKVETSPLGPKPKVLDRESLQGRSMASLEAELAVQRQLQDNAIRLSNLFGSLTGKGTFAKTSLDKLPDWLKFSNADRVQAWAEETLGEKDLKFGQYQLLMSFYWAGVSNQAALNLQAVLEAMNAQLIGK